MNSWENQDICNDENQAICYDENQATCYGEDRDICINQNQVICYDENRDIFSDKPDTFTIGNKNKLQIKILSKNASKMQINDYKIMYQRINKAISEKFGRRRCHKLTEKLIMFQKIKTVYRSSNDGNLRGVRVIFTSGWTENLYSFVTGLSPFTGTDILL